MKKESGERKKKKTRMHTEIIGADDNNSQQNGSNTDRTKTPNKRMEKETQTHNMQPEQFSILFGGDQIEYMSQRKDSITHCKKPNYDLLYSFI